MLVGTDCDEFAIGRMIGAVVGARVEIGVGTGVVEGACDVVDAGAELGEYQYPAGMVKICPMSNLSQSRPGLAFSRTAKLRPNLAPMP